MDQKKCLDAGINYEEGVARFVGNAEIYNKFLNDFISDKTFSDLEAAMNDKNIEAAFQAGHTLKGVAGNLSLNNLYDKLVVFVDALRGDGNLPLAESLYPDVQEDYKNAVSFIKENF